MEDRHIRVVRASIRALAEGEARAFYLAVDGERRLLHVHKKAAPPARFGSVSHINRHLAARSLGPPLTARARACAGWVRIDADGLWFEMTIKRGAGKRDLRKALRELRRPLLLPPAQLGTPGTPEPAPAADPADKQKRRLGTIRSFQDILADDPTLLETDELEQLLRRAERYAEDGGTEDVSDVILAARTLWEEQIREAEAARRQAITLAAEDVVRRVLHGDGRASQETARMLHDAWMAAEEDDDFSVLPPVVQDAALELAVTYARVQPEFADIEARLGHPGTDRQVELALVAALRDELQAALDTVRAAVEVV